MNKDIFEVINQHFRPGYIFRNIKKCIENNNEKYISFEVNREINYWKSKIKEAEIKIINDKESIKKYFFEGSILLYKEHIEALKKLNFNQ